MRNYSNQIVLSDEVKRELMKQEAREVKLESIVAPFVAVAVSVYSAVRFFVEMFEDTKENIAEVEENNQHVGGYWL
ncbi:hypothetical protein GCM10011450_14090 [Advenella faeciporci]|uniref:Uncharacterized protein n=1 Tax=Advenella faeciporci TaxID=797535 RepID=A0A918JKX4_9BURK|nr:hypothetical protein [Advenella faeciporci]GGW85337.1 hypothetical protein GCM10011450_14090 [Advenella faeciporci]